MLLLLSLLLLLLLLPVTWPSFDNMVFSAH